MLSVDADKTEPYPTMVGAVYAVERFAEVHGPLTMQEAELLVWHLYQMRSQLKNMRFMQSGQAKGEQR